MQWQCFGGRAWCFHLVSLLLHLAFVRALLGLWTRWAGNRRGPAWAVGLLVGVHPLSVEVVSWISSQGDLMAAALACAALGTVPRRPLIAWSLALGAILAKESALPLVWLLPVVQACAPAGAVGEKGTAGIRARRLSSIGAGALLAAGYLLWRQWALDRSAGLGSSGLGQVDADVSARIGDALQYVWLALRFTLWPWPQSVDTSHPPHHVTSWFEAAVALLVLGAASFTVVRAWRRPDREPRLRALWIVLALSFLVPTCGLLVAIRSPFAERFFLLPYAFAIALAVSVVATWLPSRWAIGAGLVALLGLAGRTVARTEDWQTQETLFRAELAVHPRSVQAHLGLAVVAVERGDGSVAWGHYRSAEESAKDGDPRRLEAQLGLGLLAYEAGDHGQALHWLEPLVDELRERTEITGRGFVAAYVALGNIARQRHSVAAGEALLEEALARYPATAELLESLGICRDTQGDPQGALEYYERARSLDSESPSLAYHTALALDHAGRRTDAVAALEALLAVRPDHTAAAQRLLEWQSGSGE